MDASNRRRRAGEEAAEWWVLLQGEVSRTQREQYVDWLRESSVHVAEMLRLAQIHGALEQFERWAQTPTVGSDDDEDIIVTLPASARSQPPPQSQPEHTPRQVRFAWLVAAALVLATALTTLLLPALHGQVIQTDRAERREVALADGSVVQVDPETRLRVEYKEHTRRVFLERGRAMFHVAKNPDRPFLVEAEDTTVRAVGTAFAVDRQPESVVVTVAEGKVAVLSSHTSDAAPAALQKGAPNLAHVHAKAPPGDGTSSLYPFYSDKSRVNLAESSEKSDSSESPVPEIFLTANEQVTVARSGNAEPVRQVDSGRALAWADGRLIFQNQSVNEAVQQFNRYNRIQLYVGDAELARRPISGVFNASDPESFVAFIQSEAAVRIIRDGAADITIERAP
jgi:transmembrane sensor